MSKTRKIIVLVWLLLQYGNSHAQYDKNWVFGYGCHLVFEEDTVLQKLSDSSNLLDDLSLSDSNGNLLFYLKNIVTNTNIPGYSYRSDVLFSDINENISYTEFLETTYRGFFLIL